MADSQKTEKATPKKRRDERQKGHVFFSNDAVAVVTLLGGFGLLWALGPSIAQRLEEFMHYSLSLAAVRPEGETFTGGAVFVECAKTLALTVGPLLAATALLAVAATIFQTKMLISGESIKPKFSRISPLQGIKRLFSLRSVVEALKGILKIAILLYLIYRYLMKVVDLLGKYLYTDLAAACGHLFQQTFSLILQIGLAFAVLAAADIFYQWWEYERQIRMSKQEIKEEYKQTEGDPQVKGKIKELQRKMAQSRMMQQVPQADVVIRNPTHYAVALRYRPEADRAPVVLAKGQDELALRIIRVAEGAKVAVVENVPLARALYAATDLNQEIPPSLYNAVAEVLVYLYRVDRGEQPR